MAFETEYANIAHPTDVVSAAMGAALVRAQIMLDKIYTEDMPVNTLTKNARKDGSLVAEGLAESTGYTYSSNSELTQSVIACTASKTVIFSKLTVEMLRTGMTVERFYALQGQAIARDLDDDIRALFSGFSTNSVTATSILTVDDILTACFKIEALEAGRVGLPLFGVFDPKGVQEIRKEIKNSGAAAFGQAQMTTLLSGLKQPNGYVGSLPGVDLFQSTGLPTSPSDDVALVYNPERAFFGMYDPSITVPPLVWKGSEGLYWEVGAYIFSKVVEWYDEAGCKVLSDT